MRTETKPTAEQIEDGLAYFCCTDHYYRHLTGRITYTDGVKYLAEQAGAYWLIDLIASHQTPALRQEEFQLWILVVDRDKTPMAVATCQSDTDEPLLVRQEIEYTDFPLDSIKLYLVKGVLMLRGEY